MDIDQYRHIIKHFDFDQCKKGNQGFNRILVQLFGIAGNGKSSFINTCKYVWEDGEYQNWAKAKGTYGGETFERIPYKLTDNITLVDNRGYKTLDSYETGEIFAQLGNLLPLDKPVTWGRGLDLVERIVKAENEVKTSDFIVPVFVHSVKRSIPDEERDTLREVMKTASKLTGVWPIAVLTHKTSGNLVDTENMIRDMGIERIFSFENYTEEDTRKLRGRHEEVLKFLCEVIKDVEFRAGVPRDPQREMIDRRKFVQKFVHEREKENQRKDLEKQEALEKAARERRQREEQQALEEKARREKQMRAEALQRQREENQRRREFNEARFRQEEEEAKAHYYQKPKKRCVLL